MGVVMSKLLEVIETVLYLTLFVLAFAILSALSGCAGTAKYSIEKGDTKLTVYNTKDVGELQAQAIYNPETGQFMISLDEKSVSASGPQAQQNELIRELIPLIKLPVIK